MGDRLKGKIAVVMGAGQTPGETIGNGRASAILYAREGAKVIVVDYRLNSADVITIMRAQRSGAILNISSIAAVCNVGILAYKTSKAGVNAITNQLALSNAKYGIRVNCIMPGLMDTPMAIEGFSRARGISKEQLRKERDAAVPLGAKMGTGWDIAHAALFLNSDEAKFITGVILPVDGGQTAKIG